MNTLALIMSLLTPYILFDFSKTSSQEQWHVVDDVVMGGVSNSSFTIEKEGIAVFSGKVSLDNNGGFASVRTEVQNIQIQKYQTIILRVKGDGKRYQLRLKSRPNERHNYISYFNTGTDWETISLPLNEFYPSFRGRKLDLPNYPQKDLNEIGILIGNGKSEEFRLEIQKIELI